MKKKLIIAGVIVVAIILGALYFHYSPVWASVTSVIALVGGCVCGWVAHVLYAKYVK